MEDLVPGLEHGKIKKRSRPRANVIDKYLNPGPK
jgi:hypothetical protein